MDSSSRSFTKSIFAILRSGFKNHSRSKALHSHLFNGYFPDVGFLDLSKKIELENALGIKIYRKEIFEQALTHRSYLQVLANDKLFSNERLEFLGDSILGMIVADYLFSGHDQVGEGELTKMRSWLVNARSLAMCARELRLDEFLMMSYSASKSLLQGSDSILADAVEALIAAIYLDSGMDSARNFVVGILLPFLMDSSIMVDTNFKSILLEKVQALGKDSPRYVVMDQKGPDHDKEFTIGVYVDDVLLAEGTGKNKKQAEQLAAQKALDQQSTF